MPKGAPEGLQVRAARVPLWARAREYTDEALGVLAGLMRHAESEMVRKSAADSLLDRAWGKAPVIVMGDDDGPKRLNIAVMPSAQAEALESALMALMGEAIASDPHRAGSLGQPEGQTPVLTLPSASPTDAHMSQSDDDREHSVNNGDDG